MTIKTEFGFSSVNISLVNFVVSQILCISWTTWQLIVRTMTSSDRMSSTQDHCVTIKLTIKSNHNGGPLSRCYQIVLIILVLLILTITMLVLNLDSLHLLPRLNITSILINLDYSDYSIVFYNTQGMNAYSFFLTTTLIIIIILIIIRSCLCYISRECPWYPNRLGNAFRCLS